jgi:uncharacterized protein involved in cysteine biosynthesis
MDGSISEQAGRRGETEEQRLDRNLGELLQELRIALPGIQVLFAFLLVVPFQQGFASVTVFERTVYFVTLLLTAAASVCFIGPTARHRIRFRDLDKKWVVETANRLALVGLVLLGAAMSGAILLTSSVLYDGATPAIATAAVAGSIAWVWFVVPLVRELRDHR